MKTKTKTKLLMGIGAAAVVGILAVLLRLVGRFKLVEQLAEEKGILMKNSSIEELDLLWDRAKEIMAEKAKTEEF